MRYRSAAGFTLIELSLVLVIIGLVVGGVLVGTTLIQAARVRATVSQIERYNTAVHTFQLKYNALPGDISGSAASQFGFIDRGQYAGEGDGNSVIEGVSDDGANFNEGSYEGAGETMLFWMDLSAANLIDGSFTSGNATTAPIGDTNIAAYFPQAKLGQGNYIYIWSGGYDSTAVDNNGHNSVNYFALANVSSIGPSNSFTAATALSAPQAAAIDSKMDDGLPQSGRVLALWPGPLGGITWAAGDQVGTADSSATPEAANNCYNNGNADGATQHYQYVVNQVPNENLNCALSFAFQ